MAQCGLGRGGVGCGDAGWGGCGLWVRWGRVEWGVVGTGGGGGSKEVRVWEVTDISQTRLKARQPEQPGKPEL